MHLLIIFFKLIIIISNNFKLLKSILNNKKIMKKITVILYIYILLINPNVQQNCKKNNIGDFSPSTNSNIIVRAISDTKELIFSNNKIVIHEINSDNNQDFFIKNEPTTENLENKGTFSPIIYVDISGNIKYII